MANETRTRGASPAELHSDARKFYEQYWNLGSQVSRTTAERNEALIRALFPSPPQGQKILEIGVGGEGGLLLGLREGNTVCGLDASASGVDGCSRLGVPARLFDADREPTDPHQAD
jgi:hypothetical protein